MYPLIGLNLLRLLSESKIAEFHVEVEALDADVIMSNIYIKHPIQVEQCLMEGSYNKIWLKKANVPAEEYLYFMEILVDTMRREIAGCCERAYSSIPLTDVATLLYLKKEKVLKFVEQLGWSVDKDEQRIVFVGEGSGSDALAAGKIIKHTLEYAKELERIV